MKHLTCILSICLSFLFNMSIASAEDFFLADAVAQQMKSWNAAVQQGRGSRRCNAAFHGAVGKTALRADIVASRDRLENISQLCEAKNDVLGEGLIWTDRYVKLTMDEKGQILNRSNLLEAISRALVLLTVDKLDPGLKASLTALATEIAHYRQKFSQIVALAERAEAQFAALGIDNSLSLAVAVSNKAYAKRKTGDNEAGLKELLRAEKMLQRLDKVDRVQLAIVYRRLADVYDLMDQPRHAIEYNEKAKKLFDEFGAKIESANLSFNKGKILLEIGLYDQAIDTFSESKNIYLLNGKEKELGGTLFNLGKAWYGKGIGERALIFYKQAERILIAQQDYVELAKVYNSMGVLHENRMTEASYRKAQQYYEKAENLFNTYSARPQKHLVTVAINKGKLYERWGRYEDAHKEYRLAEQHIVGARTQLRFVINNNLAFIAMLRKEYDQALDYAQKALKDLEETFALGFYFAGASNLRFMDQHRSPYFIAVEALIKKGELKKAYALREVSRNKSFQVMVRMKGEEKNEQGIESLWQQKIELDSAISALDHRAVQSQSDTARVKLKLQRKKLKKTLESVESGLFANPDLYRKIFLKESLDINMLQSNIKREEALIDYQVWAKPVAGDIHFQINAFIIKRDSIKLERLFERLDAYKSLEMVKEYCNLQKPQTLQQYNNKNELELYKQSIRKGAKNLYQVLFKKIDTELNGITKIFIIPDGPLNLLPFETLRDQQGKLLIEKYAISYLNSAADVYQHSVNANKGFLVFGDIDYGLARDGLREWSSIAGSADILADIINSMQDKMSTTYVHNADATESRFNEVSLGHKVVLIWSHGEFSDYSQVPENLYELQSKDEELPINIIKDFDAWNTYQYRRQFNDPLSNSFVVLAAVNQGGDGRHDGYLTAREVMALNLQGTELTILAACETGLGQSSPSEGVMGLRKAFSLAGSRQLLISLWQVDAKWTGELIKSMMSNYEKQGGARALQNAKISLIKNIRDEGLEPFPFYWAGFVLAGKGN